MFGKRRLLRRRARRRQRLALRRRRAAAPVFLDEVASDQHPVTEENEQVGGHGGAEDLFGIALPVAANRRTKRR